MRPKNLCLALLLVLCVSVAVSLSAQAPPQTNPTSGQTTSVPPQETKLGDYIAAGSIDVGYRFVDASGTEYPCFTSAGVASTCNYTGMYNTFVDLRQGPRIFDQTLSLRSIGNTGVLFDNMFVSSFGWGGDPENVARLRMNKHKAYDLSVLFRRDYQRFDYNLLANPLNPSTSVPNVPILFSPHRWDTARRMTDVNLTIAPTSPISIRLGYNRNRVEGPTFSTFHMPMGTDINPTQGYNYTNDGIRAGVDLKFIPRTTFSFDGFVNWYKNDTALGNPFFESALAGIPTTFGISWNSAANQPCGPVAIGTPLCNLDFFFSRQDRFRSTMPTVSASVQSHYWNRVDLTARILYGWADLDSNWNQLWNGFTTRPRARQDQIVNTVRNRRISNGADFGITFHVTDHFRISDSFHYVNQKMPVFGTSIDTLWTAPVGGNALTPIAAIIPVATGTGVDQGLFWNARSNETDFEFDLGRWAGVTIGYRYMRRYITDKGEGFDVDALTGEPIIPEGAEVGFDHFRIPEHAAIGGLWIRPSEKFRLNFDVEAASAGIATRSFNADEGVDFQVTGLTTFTRLTPRHHQQYRARATFLPMHHVSVGASLNIYEQRNSLTDLEYRFHNRNYGFNATISPNERFLLDLAYNYQDFLQTNFVCSVFTPGPGTFPGPALLTGGLCAGAPAGSTPIPYVGAFGDYSTQTHFGSIMFRVKPVSRVTASVGYSIINNDGAFPQFNALQPTGPTQFNYHRPIAALEIGIARGLALKGGWDYYDYNEKGSSANLFGTAGPTLPRDFHAHTGTVGLRYTF